MRRDREPATQKEYGYKPTIMERARLSLADGIVGSWMNNPMPPFGRIRAWAFNQRDGIMAKQDWAPLLRVPVSSRKTVLDAISQSLPKERLLSQSHPAVLKARGGVMAAELPPLSRANKRMARLAKEGIRVLARQPPEKIAGATEIRELSQELDSIDGKKVSAKTYYFGKRGGRGNRPVAVLVPGIGHGLDSPVHYSVANFLVRMGFDVIGIHIPEYEDAAGGPIPAGVCLPSAKSAYLEKVLRQMQTGRIGNNSVDPRRLIGITHSLGVETWESARKNVGGRFAPPVLIISPRTAEQMKQSYKRIASESGTPLSRKLELELAAVTEKSVTPVARPLVKRQNGARVIVHVEDPLNKIRYGEKWNGLPTQFGGGYWPPYFFLDEKYHALVDGLGNADVQEKILGLRLSEYNRSLWSFHNWFHKNAMTELLLRVHNFAHAQGLV